MAIFYCASNDKMYELCIYLCSHVHLMVICTTFVKCILQQINVLTTVAALRLSRSVHTLEIDLINKSSGH